MALTVFTINLFISYFILGEQPLYSRPTQRRKHIELAQNPAFDAVGKLELSFANADKTRIKDASCNGVLIDPGTLLTTADCIEPLIKDKKSAFDSTIGMLLYENTFTLGNNLYGGILAQSNFVNATHYNNFNYEMSTGLLAALCPPTTTKKSFKYFLNSRQRRKRS